MIYSFRIILSASEVYVQYLVATNMNMGRVRTSAISTPIIGNATEPAIRRVDHFEIFNSAILRNWRKINIYATLS